MDAAADEETGEAEEAAIGSRDANGRGREEESDSGAVAEVGGRVGEVDIGALLALAPALEDTPVKSIASTRGSCDDRFAAGDDMAAAGKWYEWYEAGMGDGTWKSPRLKNESNAEWGG